MLTTNELFDEIYYLNTNTDVAAAVSGGNFRSGLEHFERHGQFEIRRPSAYFDPSYYLEQNQDVANAVNAGQTTAVAHFISFGQNENRDPNALFDISYYLEQNQDVAAAVATGGLTGIEHFIESGDFEGRSSNPLFDPGFYLGQNSDVAQAVQQRAIGAAEHFITYGDFEGRAPSRFFNPDFYLSQNSDVAQARQQRVTGAAEHFIEYGQFEGRTPRQLFDRIYVFGDSQSDDGNLFAIINGTLPPSPPYFEGRFSNGLIWTEYLASRLNLTDVQANLDNNFAIGGATTGTEDVVVEGFPPAPGLQRQVDNFTIANPSADPNALYVVYAGGNDYFGGATDVTPTINNLANAVTKLAGVGARNFMLPNLPNPSASPASASQGSEFQQRQRQIVDSHAAALAARGQILEQNPNINVISVDFTGFLRRLRENPQTFGITNLGGVVPGVAFDESARGFIIPPEVNPDEYLYWDQVHLSTRTHQLLANTALTSITALEEVVEIL